MVFLSQVGYLLWKDAKAEWRNQAGFSAMVMYVAGSVFIIYIGMAQLDAKIWNALFWILVLFAGVSVVIKNDNHAINQRAFYDYTLFSPYSVIIAKLIFNSFLLCFVSILILVLLNLFTIQPISNYGNFLAIVVAGSFVLSIIFTFVGFIAQRATNQNTLIAILGFPLTIPVFLTNLKISANALRLISDSSIGNDWLILFSISLILLALSLLLIPYLWHE